MNILVTCPECCCHVRRSDVTCPFCGTPTPRSDGVRSLERLGHAALLTFSTASGIVACGGATGSANAAAVATPERSPVSSTVAPSPAPAKREATPETPPAPPLNAGNTAAAYGGPPLPPSVPVPASPPPARVEIGALSVTGGTIPNVEGAVSTMRGGFETCFARGQAAHPEAEGQVTVTIRLGGAGQILGVAAQQTAKVPATVVSCMTTKAAASQFDPPTGAKGQVTLVVPVTLTKP